LGVEITEGRLAGASKSRRRVRKRKKQGESGRKIMGKMGIKRQGVAGKLPGVAKRKRGIESPKGVGGYAKSSIESQNKPCHAEKDKVRQPMGGGGETGRKNNSARGPSLSSKSN